MVRTRGRRSAGRIAGHAALCLVVLGVVPAAAECVLPGPVCEQFALADAVFVADVAAVRWAEEPRPTQVVTFQVIDSFKGALESGQLTLPFVAGSAEEFRFEEGRRVLVYAKRREAGWSSMCTRTRLVAGADAEVSWLHSLSRQVPGAIVSVELRRDFGEGDRRLSRARIVLRSGRSVVVDAESDQAGRLDAGWLDPGDYTLEVLSGESPLATPQTFRVEPTTGCLRLEAAVARSAELASEAAPDSPELAPPSLSAPVVLRGEDQAESPPVVEPGANGVSWPKALRSVNPEYTEAAKAHKIEGVVHLTAVVGTDGTVGRIRLTRSLDAVYGLDDAAVRAASQWSFEPATKDGKPVPVRIEIVMEFRLR